MNVNFNLISATLTPEDHAAIIAGIKAIEALIPFAVTLPKDEKSSLSKVGVKSLEFIKKSHEYAAKNPTLTPQYLDMVEFEKDSVLVGQLQTVMDHLVPLTTKLSDTYTLAGSEAYNAARVFYHHIRNASRINVPGASAVSTELGKSFKDHGPKKKTPEEKKADQERKKAGQAERTSGQDGWVEQTAPAGGEVNKK